MSLGEIVESHEEKLSALQIKFDRLNNQVLTMENRLIEHDIKPKWKEKVIQFIQDRKRAIKYVVTLIISGGSIAKVLLYLVENDLIFDFVLQFFQLSIVLGGVIIG